MQWNRYSEWNTKHKVLLVAVSLLSIMLFVSSGGLIGLHILQGKLRTELRHRFDTMTLMDDLDTAVTEAHHAAQQAGMAENLQQCAGWAEIYDRHLDDIGSLLARQAQDLTVTPEERQGWDELGKSLTAWTKQATAMIQPQAFSIQPTTRPSVTLRNNLRQVRLRTDDLRNKFYHPLMEEGFANIEQLARSMQIVLLIALITGLVIGTLVTRGSIVAIMNQEHIIDARNHQLESETRRQEFEARLSRSLDMTRTEEEVSNLAKEILAELIPGMQYEVLVADSSQAHLRRMLSNDESAVTALCGVARPYDCPAVRRGQAMTFETSEAFDACPYLRHRPAGACSAACVPLTIMGRSVGVLHAAGPERETPTHQTKAMIAQVVGKSGDHIGWLRAFKQSETQATTDTLTGLLNRRSVEDAIVELNHTGKGYALVYADIDHFKRLNDTYGHDTGDRALRVFSRALRESLRSNDLVARWGGEEFILVLPALRTAETMPLLERVRSHLSNVLSSGSLPCFTISFGVGDTEDAPQFKDLLDLADAALLSAKKAGRNCIKCVSEQWAAAAASPVSEPRPEPEPEPACI